MEPGESHVALRGTVHYVDGLLFNESRNRVVLIRKNSPEWQKGKLNAVGGKVETLETPHQAMVREFEEEAGVRIPEWNHFLTLRGRGFNLECFWAVASGSDFASCKSQTDEKIERIDVDCLPFLAQKLNNLEWMIHMALSMIREQCTGFVVEEQYGQRLHDNVQRLRQADKWLT